VLFSEPKIPQFPALPRRRRAGVWFQCSSASRKFLNKTSRPTRRTLKQVSVLFSEPKIPQSVQTRAGRAEYNVSVLFSEPKIPQSTPATLRGRSG